MATISSLGVGSGIDANSIVTQLLAVERIPLTQLQTESTALQTKLSTYGKMKSAMSAVRDAAAALSRTDNWKQTKGVSSDTTAIDVATTTATSPGQHLVRVQTLAMGQSNATANYASANSVVGGGTLSIQLGTWTGTTAFAPAGAVVDVVIGPPAKTLEEVRDTINAANAGVVASVLIDSNGARLVVRSSATGENNGFKIGVADMDGNNTNAAGLSALAYDPLTAVTRLARSQVATSATGTLNGLAVKSSSNTLTNVIDGMTLTFKKVTAAAIPVSAEQDNAGIRKSVDTFVTAYNDLNKLIADQTRFDVGNTRRDNLQGDSAAISMRTQMRAMLGQTSGSSTTLKRAADVGLDVQTDGSIKVNEAKLSSGMATIAEMQKLFGNTDLLVPANNGLGVKLRILADQMLSSDGTIKSRSEGLQKRIDLNRDRQDRLSDRIADTEKRLRAQYTALDRQMATLQGLSGYVQQQFGSSNNNN